MPHRWWIDWIAYEQIEPSGFEMENWRAGMIASTIANTAGKVLRSSTSPRDFMPKPAEKPQPLGARVLAAFEAVAAALPPSEVRIVR